MLSMVDLKSEATSFRPLILVLVLVFAVSVRIAVLWYNLQLSFYQDAYFDNCIKPGQFWRGESIWGIDTNYISYLIALLVGALFPMEGLYYSLASLFFFISLTALSYRLLHLRYHASDRQQVLDSFCWMIVLESLFFPTIVHTVYTSAMAWAAGFVSLFLALLLIWDTSRERIILVILAGLTALAAYVYPGLAVAFLATFFGWVLIRERSLIKESAVYTIIVGIIFLCLKGVWWTLGYGRGQNKQLAGGFFSLTTYPLSVRTILEDTFYSTSSWGAVNGGWPYFTYALLPILLLALVQRRMLLLRFFAILEFAVFMASFAWPYPGVRRILWVWPILFFLMARIYQEVSQNSARPVSQLWSVRLWWTGCLLMAILAVETSLRIGSLPNSEERWGAIRDFIEREVQDHAKKPDQLLIFSRADQFQGTDIECRARALKSLKGVRVTRFSDKLAVRPAWKEGSLLISSEEFSHIGAKGQQIGQNANTMWVYRSPGWGS